MPKYVDSFRQADGAIINLVGKQARTLRALMEAGSAGITPADVSALGWAFRLSAYIRALRLKGCNIETVRQELADGGPIIGRYVLREKVERVDGEEKV